MVGVNYIITGTVLCKLCVCEAEVRFLSAWKMVLEKENGSYEMEKLKKIYISWFNKKKVVFDLVNKKIILLGLSSILSLWFQFSTLWFFFLRCLFWIDLI